MRKKAGWIRQNGRSTGCRASPGFARHACDWRTGCGVPARRLAEHADAGCGRKPVGSGKTGAQRAADPRRDSQGTHATGAPDVVFLLDVSRSMLTRDAEESRLDQAKPAINGLQILAGIRKARMRLAHRMWCSCSTSRGAC